MRDIDVNIVFHPSSLCFRVFQRRILRRRGLTFIEILVVVAIIGLLAAILFPVFAQVREKARRTSCVSQLHQIGLAMTMYRQDSEGWPPLLSRSYPGYVNDANLLICPNNSQRGQFPGNTRLEGNLHLSSGVSYEYFPRWTKALEWGWWQPGPDFGEGKWQEMTPLVGCPWHWAKFFDPEMDGNKPGSNGWELILTAGGSVRKVRIEQPLEDFTPAKYS